MILLAYASIVIALPVSESIQYVTKNLTLSKEWKHFGLKGPEEMSQASLGTPLEVYSLIWEKDPVHEYPVEFLLPLSEWVILGHCPYGRWIIPVLVDEDPRFLIFADGERNEMELVAYGAALFTERLETFSEESARKAVELVTDDRIEHVKLIASERLSLYFWVVETTRMEYVVPLYNITQELKAGKAGDPLYLCEVMQEYPGTGVIRDTPATTSAPESITDSSTGVKGGYTAASVDLVDPQFQWHSKWCWAASLGNVFRTIGGQGTCDEPTQCMEGCWQTGFVSYRGIFSQNQCSPVDPEQRCDGPDGPERCCSYETDSPCNTCDVPDPYFYSHTECCNRGCYVNQLLIMVHAFGWEGTRANQPIPWITMKVEIDSGRPFETDGDGHVVCVYGYIDPGQIVMYFDPWVDMGYMQQSYSTFTSNSYGSWGGIYQINCESSVAVEATITPMNGTHFNFKVGETAKARISYECFVDGDYILYVIAEPDVDKKIFGPRQFHMKVGDILSREFSMKIPENPGLWDVSAVVDDTSHEEIHRDTVTYLIY
jgi:hypothetical protein